MPIDSGIKLGAHRGYRHNARQAKAFRALGGAKRREAADVAALSAADLIASIRASLPGKSLGATAKALNDAGAITPRGGAWTATAVKRALARIEASAAP